MPALDTSFFPPKGSIGTDVGLARAVLEAGGLVGIPTETVYGLAANGLNPETIAQIFAAKNRPTFDPLILHLANPSQVLRYVTYFPAQAKALAKAFWPGPLTLVLPKTEVVPLLATSGMPSVALRVPQHPLTLQLLQQLSFPLAAPSANPFGYISPTTAAHVQAQLGTEVDYILDGGPCRVGIESTIVAFEPNSAPVVLRQGGISNTQLAEVLGQAIVTQTSSSQPKAPGMLSSHYAPRAQLVLVKAGQALPTELLLPNDVGWLGYQNAHPGIEAQRQRILSPLASTQQAAQNLFAYLRELDALGLRIIVAELAPNEGLGPAINDRLQRAAAPRPATD